MCKLPLEEALAVAQQVADAEANQVVGEVVGCGVELGIEIGKAVENDATFGLVELERLIHILLEEAEHVEVTAQSTVFQQFGAKRQHPATRLAGIIQIHRNHLARAEGEDSTSTVAHRVSTAYQFTKVFVHQHHAIHAKVQGFEQREVSTREVSHCHIGMERRLVEVMVVFINVGYLFHYLLEWLFVVQR